MLAVSATSVNKVCSLYPGVRGGQLTAGVGSLESTGDLGGGRGRLASATANLDLTTADIPLRRRAGVVLWAVSNASLF